MKDCLCKVYIGKRLISKIHKAKVKILVARLCLTLCDPMDCSPPGSSVCGILQARILEWIAILFSRGSFQPEDCTQVSCVAGRFFIDVQSMQ